MATRLERGIDWGTKLPDRKVTYGFIPEGDKAPSPFGKMTSEGFDAYEKAQFKLAFKIFATFTDLRFRQVEPASNADLYLLTYDGQRTSLGAMGPPGYPGASGYGAFNHRGYGWDEDEQGTGGLEQGGYGFVTIIHELGHGLGLAHPHDGGGTSSVFPGVSGSGNRGRFGLNQGVYTMMSYNDGWETNPAGEPPGYDYGFEGTPMAIDIAVLQKKYGVNDSYHKGDTTYALPDVNESGTFYACIWDAGGRDIIVNDSDIGSIIDLRAATLKPKPGGGGFLSYADGIFGGFTIAHNVTIEDARGGVGDDILIGNAARNRLDGAGGDDQIYGRGGSDRLIGGPDTDRLYGGPGNDTLVAGAGDDVLKGGRGADRLIASAGSATLSGGKGTDIFEFNERPSTEVLVTIDDFSPGRDLIHLALDAFSSIGALGTLAARAFSAGPASVPAVRILYDSHTGVVSLDEDGSGPSAAVSFARLAPGLDLTHADFVVVA